MIKTNRLGEEILTKKGDLVKIIEYHSSEKVKYVFVDLKLEGVTTYSDFKKGTMRNPYSRTVCGIGFLGVGDFNVQVNNKRTNEYAIWSSMINRCYNEKMLVKNPTYNGVVVCEEWHNFQNFASWWAENKVKEWELDKDILIKGNKIYSPETCCVVPLEINYLFMKLKPNPRRLRLPLGVVKHKAQYLATCKVDGKNIQLGLYKNPNDAFLAYKTFKEKQIKVIAERWKGKISEKVYDIMVNYEIVPF